MVQKGNLAVCEDTMLPVEGLIADTAKYSPSPLQLMLQVSSCD